MVALDAIIYLAMKYALYRLIALLTLSSTTTASATEVIGYRDVAWGTQFKSVVATLKPNRESLESSCEGHMVELPSDAIGVVLSKLVKLPGLNWNGSRKNDIPFEHAEKFKWKRVGEGCGLFFKDKFIAQYVTPTGSNEDVRAALNRKYGYLRPQKVESTFKSDSIYLQESKNTLIVFFPDRMRRSLSGNGDFPRVWYFSNQHEKELSDSLSLAKKSQDKDDAKQRIKSKGKLDNSL